MSLLATLIHMHTYCRPAGSATERLFIAEYVATLPGAYQDEHHNWHVQIGDSRILWSCHTDTVHDFDGRQTLHYDALNSILALSRRSKSHGRNCLGADDTAGVFICAQMILAGIPGHYVFHYAEECGGIGSKDLATYEADWLSLHDYAIAFDRRGTKDIVTHQWCIRTASDIFAYGLSEALDVAGMPAYAPHDGIYTDTAEYEGIIAECSNLSVGYRHEHTPNETLDTAHVLRLLAAMLKLDHASLVHDREPGSDDDWRMGYLYEPTAPHETITIGATDYANPDTPVQHFCLMCDERVNPLIEHDCPAELDNAAYLDRVYGDVQRALAKSNGNTAIDLATWKLRHRRVS
jgi:hypothetical protein